MTEETQELKKEVEDLKEQVTEQKTQKFYKTLISIPISTFFLAGILYYFSYMAEKSFTKDEYSIFISMMPFADKIIPALKIGMYICILIAVISSIILILKKYKEKK